MDIGSIKDIELLVETFYQKAIADQTIGYFFTEVMKTSLEDHLPIIVSFWNSVLLQSATYKGNVMMKHIELHQKSTLEEKHFKRWFSLWCQTIDELFEGEIADEAKHKAKLMKELMMFKIAASQNPNFIA